MTRTSNPPPDNNAQPTGVRRVEWIAIVILLLLGGALRFAYAERISVEHFDEGVYASNMWFGAESGYAYPMRHLYAPPMFPAIVEWVSLLFGPSAARFINPTVGTLTILLVWWMGRNWFGPLAGMTAATLCATSDFHIAYSRTLLTDPLLCFWLLAAVYCLGEAHLRVDRRWAVAGGLLTGLAWWTKYNGWLPLAIQIAGVGGWMVFGGKQSRGEWKLHLGLIVVAVVVTGIVWFPVPYALQDAGGYAAVAENHRGYLVGIDGWWDSLTRQVAAHRHFEGATTLFGIGMAVLLGVGVVSPIELKAKHALTPLAVAVALLPIGASFLAGASVVFGVGAVVGLLMWLKRPCETMNRGDGSAVCGWMVTAWFVGLLVATPMYRAYPRLTLPWLVVAWLGTGVFVSWAMDRLVERRSEPEANFFSRHAGALSALVGIACLVVGHNLDDERIINRAAWQDRRGMAAIASVMLKSLQEKLPPADGDGETTPVIYVHGEPALFHQLNAEQQDDQRKGEWRSFAILTAGGVITQPQRINGKAVPTFLVTGPHAHRDPAFQKQLKQAGRRLEPVGEPWPYLAADLVLLNEYAADEIADKAKRPKLWVRVYRVR